MSPQAKPIGVPAPPGKVPPHTVLDGKVYDHTGRECVPFEMMGGELVVSLSDGRSGGNYLLSRLVSS
jgi:hypothetical protein